MEEQEKVARFLERHGLEATPGFRILDLASEVGEIAGDAAKSSNYGINTESLEVGEDELGDAFFSLLALADDLEIDASRALDRAIEKYRSRIEETGDAGSR